MVQLDAVYQAICFIEDHLQEPIDMNDIAQAASYSLYHFCRVFSKVTRHKPHDYLIRRRMTQASQLIVHEQRKIVDIAMDFQFESHEGFTRAFSRVFGLSPIDARKQAHVPVFRQLPALTLQHLTCLQKHDYLIPQKSHTSKITLHCEHIVDLNKLPDTLRDQALCVLLPNDGTTSMSLQGMLSSLEDLMCFSLADTDGDLGFVFDWILYGWLFYAAYELHSPLILIQQNEHNHMCIYVPVA